MSLSNTTVLTDYLCNGSVVDFNIQFAFFDVSQIQVLLIDETAPDDAPLVLVAGADFEFDHPTAPTKITTDVAYSADFMIRIQRVTTLTQIISYINNGPFLAKDHEKGLDRIVMMVQEIAKASGADGSAILLNILDQATANPVLAKLVASNVIGVNATADGFVMVDRAEFKGDKGDKGDTGEFDSFAVTGELEYDDVTPISVTNVGTTTDAQLQFVLRKGPKGDPGTTSYAIYTEVTDPTVGDGNNGDIWINTVTGDLFQKELGAWGLRGNIKGPTGPAGGVDSFNTRQGAVVPVTGDYDASMIDYDNTTSGLTATDEQAAIDELVVITSDLQDQIDNIDPLPSQTGNNGKFLTTNGTVASWANVDALPSQTGNAGKVLTTNGTTASWVAMPDGRYAVSAEQNITDGGSPTLQNVARQRILVKGSAADNAMILPAGTIDGQELLIEGTSNSSWVKLSDSGNVYCNGDRSILNNTCLKFIWNSTKIQWIIQGS